MIPPDILNSKIKKIRIELPNYSFSHSAAGDSFHAFIGRERTREKIKKVIEDSPDEPGVNLVAGNRGVGKTSLISWVINKTSLRPKTKFTENFKYIIFLLLAVNAVFIATEFCLKKFPEFSNKILLIFPVLFIPTFIMLCFLNSYRHKYPEQKQGVFRIIQNRVSTIFYGIIFALKELSYLLNPHNPNGKMQFVLKIILVTCWTQIIPRISFYNFFPFIKFAGSIQITPLIALIYYLFFIFALMFRRFVRDRFRKYYIKYKKNKLSGKSIYNIENTYYMRLSDTISILSSMALLFLPLWNNYNTYPYLNKLLIVLSPFILIHIFNCIWCSKYLKKGLRKSFRILFHDIIVNPIQKYINNYNRLYLRINFGHKLRDEKDILRLIARSLSTQYIRYHQLFRRWIFLRGTKFGLLIIFAYLFSPIINCQKPVVNSKILSEYQVLEDNERSIDAFSGNTEKLLIIDAEPIADNTVKIQINHTWHKHKLCAWIFAGIKKIPPLLDQFALYLYNSAVKILTYLWNGNNGNIHLHLINNINYFRCLVFFLLCLFFALLFRCPWISHFFVTHQRIMQRLKKLNSDITHRSELENSIGINNEKGGPALGIRAKKSRNIADAREIEKELQDILNDIQRIPVIMCRPKVVIVFDELDKVEPGDTGSEKESPQTKATLFSIDATRERQTEILRILSNMKYFLSTAKAKFIFIAGREMFDIHLADVSERNNYIGSIFNIAIHVPSLLTDHHTGKESIPSESSIASLPEEFVCRRLIPHDYPVEAYNLKNYRIYLENVIYKDKHDKIQKKEMVHKIIAVLQQFVIYLAHVSKGAPKKMVQLFESFVETHIERGENKRNTLSVQRCHNSRHFLCFNYYKQYTLGIVAYLITPIFYRLAESNIKEHSDKLLVSALRFVDFMFKFQKHSFSWKHLDMSPEMLEVNRAPELKSIAVDLLNYLAQVHITKSNFSLTDYKFDGLISNEIFAMAKTDEVFSALFSFSLDESLSLKKHYEDLLEKTKKEYQTQKKSSVYTFIDAVTSLQGVLGDLHYYDDELEEAEAYYKTAVQALRKFEQEKHGNAEKRDEKKTLEELYIYVRNMLRLGLIYEKRKQYDFAYLTYSELCERIIRERNITVDELNSGIVLRKTKNGKIVFVEESNSQLYGYNKKYHDSIKISKLDNINQVDPRTASVEPLNFRYISPNTYNTLFKKMTFEGLKMLYLPFIAKLQILELSHAGGITCNHLELLDKEFKFLTFIINQEEAKILKAEFYSRVADILYYKNSDLKCKKNISRKEDKDEYGCYKNNYDNKVLPENCSCTVCYYYHKALSILFNLDKTDKDKNTVRKLLYASVEQIKNDNNVKFYTILARILSDWGNVFFSCDKKENSECYICDKKDCKITNPETIMKMYIDYTDSESASRDTLLNHFKDTLNMNFTKMEIAFAMYTISSVAYRKANLYKRSSFQLYKMLCLFIHYEIYKKQNALKLIKRLSKQAIHYLWYANDDLHILELNKRKKDFGKEPINKKIPLQSLLVDTEITKIRVLVKEIKLKLSNNPKGLKKYYKLRITSPYKINYSITGRIYRLSLKTKVNFNAYLMLLKGLGIAEEKIKKSKFVLNQDYYNKMIESEECKKVVNEIFGEKYDIAQIYENLIADSIYCLTDIAQLTETMDETYLFPHSFLGTVHEHLSFWIRQYEAFEKFNNKNSHIKKYLKQYLDEEWRDLLSGYRENQRALSHYNKCLEMHNEGRAYHNMIDTLCYIEDDYNDRSYHFNIAEERHFIVNNKIKDKINELKDVYNESELYKVRNYYENNKKKKKGTKRNNWQ